MTDKLTDTQTDDVGLWTQPFAMETEVRNAGRCYLGTGPKAIG